MGDNAMLQFQYKGRDVGVFVEDIDKINFIDLIIEYWENAEKAQVVYPKFPKFTYLQKMSHIDLNSDKDLVNMFSNLQDKSEIIIWVNDLSEPSTIVKDAMSLRSTQNGLNMSNVGLNNEHCEELNQLTPTPTPLRPKKFTPRRKNKENVIPPIVQFASFEQDGYCNNIDLDETAADIVANRALLPRGRGRGRGKPKDKGKKLMFPEVVYLGDKAIAGTETEIFLNKPLLNNTHLNIPTESQGDTLVANPSPNIPNEPQGETPLTNQLKLSTPFLNTPITTGVQKAKRATLSASFLKKVPWTTALRKGLEILNPELQVGIVEHSSRRRAPKAASVTSHSDGSEDDDEYKVEDDDDSTHDDAHDDTEVSLIDEDEPRSEDDYEIMLHDNYDPYEEENWDILANEENDYMAKLYNNGEMYKDKGFGSIELRPWQLFIDKNHLKEVIRDYCIQSGFAVIVSRANNTMYTVLCSALNCGWKLHASKLPDGQTWAIKYIKNPEHTCVGLDSKNPMVNVEWGTRVLMEDIRANNDVPTKTLNKLLFERYGVEMAKSTLYSVKKKALTEIHGVHDVSYGYLPNYCEVIKSLNPNSVAQCAWNQPNHPERPLAFSSIFICFKGALDGVFAGCRSLIGVDGAHLKGNYGGVLLSAVAMDGNNEIFPFAWAVVGSEDESSWMFFIHHIKNVLQGGGRGDKWCIISDRQKGIDNAINNLWPKVGRRYCTKHLSKNFKTKFPGPLMLSLFWRVTGAYSLFTYGKEMKLLQSTTLLAKVWLTDIGPVYTWSKHAFDPDVKCDTNKTNFVESFYATLGVDRCMPILTLLEGIRRVTMVRMATRRQTCEDWSRDDICPNIMKRLQVINKESRFCLAYPSGPGEYEVTEGRSTLRVSLNYHTCDCCTWQISGLPCKHGMRAIKHAKLDPHTFASPWYHVQTYKQAYSFNINSLPDREQWPETSLPNIQPPTIKRGVGRPPRNRRREEEEQRKCQRSKTVKCGICKEFGHNAQTCKGGLTTKQKKGSKKKKGRELDVQPEMLEHGASTSCAIPKKKRKIAELSSQPPI